MRASSLFLLLVFVCGCNGGIDGLPPDAYQAEADAVIALSFAAAPNLPIVEDQTPAPDDRPKPGVCEDCNGSGRSGDGLGKCGTCGGTGRIEGTGNSEPPEFVVPVAGTEPAGKATSDWRSIVMHTTPEANREGWPQRWWRETRPQLVADGWTVSVVKDESGAASFEVESGENTYTLFGEQEKESFK